MDVISFVKHVNNDKKLTALQVKFFYVHSFLVDESRQTPLKSSDDLLECLPWYFSILTDDFSPKILLRCGLVPVNRIFQLSPQEKVTWIEIRAVRWPIHASSELRFIIETDDPAWKVFVQ